MQRDISADDPALPEPQLYLCAPSEGLLGSQEMPPYSSLSPSQQQVITSRVLGQFIPSAALMTPCSGSAPSC